MPLFDGALHLYLSCVGVHTCSVLVNVLFLTTGSDDRSVHLWDVSTGHLKHTISAHTCADLAFDEEKVVTASFDNTIGMWDWKTGECLQVYQGHVGAGELRSHDVEKDALRSGHVITHKNLAVRTIMEAMHTECTQKRDSVPNKK